MRIHKLGTFLLTHFPRQVFNRLKVKIDGNDIVARHDPCGLIIDLTTACNMNCPFCSTKEYRSKMPSKHLLLSEAKKLMSKFDTATGVAFCGAGETFLNPDLFAMARYANELKINVMITTNGTLLQKRMNELLISKINTLEISIKGVCGKDYARFTGRKEAEFYSIVESIKELTKYRYRPRIIISYVCDRKRVYKIPDILKIARKCNVDEVCFYNLIPNRELKNESNCLYETDKQLVLKILNDSSKEASGIIIKGPGLYSLDSSTRRDCRAPFKFLRVAPDGGVSGCPRAIDPSLESGNAFVDDDVFNNPHFRILRNELTNNNIPLRYECLYCDIR